MNPDYTRGFADGARAMREACRRLAEQLDAEYALVAESIAKLPLPAAPVPLGSIHDVPMLCPNCGWQGAVSECEPDVDGDGSLGCPTCQAVVRDAAPETGQDDDVRLPRLPLSRQSMTASSALTDAELELLNEARDCIDAGKAGHTDKRHCNCVRCRIDALLALRAKGSERKLVSFPTPEERNQWRDDSPWPNERAKGKTS